MFQAKWDEASKKTIQISTKPCPMCRTPTERDGTLVGINFPLMISLEIYGNHEKHIETFET